MTPCNMKEIEEGIRKLFTVPVVGPSEWAPPPNHSEALREAGLAVIRSMSKQHAKEVRHDAP